MLLNDKGIIAVDPGKSGAIAIFLNEGGEIIEDMPLIPNITKDYRLDCLTFARLLSGYGPERYQVVIEKQQVMPKDRVQSRTALFNAGVLYGSLIGVAESMGYVVHLVQPSVWKRALSLGREKEQARGLALQQFPALRDDLRRKKDHNRAEALLLGLYCKRMVS